MARVFTAKARKDYPQYGIKKGDTYYYWSVGFRGSKQMSLTRPRPSQLTGSKMAGAYAASEGLEDAIGAVDNIDDLISAMDEAIDAIRDVAQEYQDSFDSLPENFQQSSNAQEMEEKASNLNDWADSIESDKSEIEALAFEDYADMDIDVSELPEDLIAEIDELCEDCEGTGHIGDEEIECIECGGTGQIKDDPDYDAQGNLKPGTEHAKTECAVCKGTGFVDNTERKECPTCDATGQVQKRVRKDITDFDDLTDEEKQSMLDAAKEIASKNVDCPL